MSKLIDPKMAVINQKKSISPLEKDVILRQNILLCLIMIKWGRECNIQIDIIGFYELKIKITKLQHAI